MLSPYLRPLISVPLSPGLLQAGESQATLLAIRHNTHTGGPLEPADFLSAVERQTKRRLALQKRGPKRAAEPGKSQGTFSFGALPI